MIVAWQELESAAQWTSYSLNRQGAFDPTSKMPRSSMKRSQHYWHNIGSPRLMRPTAPMTTGHLTISMSGATWRHFVRLPGRRERSAISRRNLVVRAARGLPPASRRPLARRRDPEAAASRDSAVHDQHPWSPQRSRPRPCGRSDPTAVGSEPGLDGERLRWDAHPAARPPQRRADAPGVRGAQRRCQLLALRWRRPPFLRGSGRYIARIYARTEGNALVSPARRA